MNWTSRPECVAFVVMMSLLVVGIGSAATAAQSDSEESGSQEKPAAKAVVIPEFRRPVPDDLWRKLSDVVREIDRLRKAVENARRKQQVKHGGGRQRVNLD